jgi:hypothetical protein
VVAHHRRGIAARFARFRTAGLGGFVAFMAVLGPGLLAGLSDDDPAGITTYSVLGADHGYALLWIIPASTILLVQFHLMAVRIGAASGKGFVAVIRDRWGHRWGYFAVAGLLFANFGTICAEYAGISAAGSLVGIPSWVSAPIAAVLISLVVVLGLLPSGRTRAAVHIGDAGPVHRRRHPGEAGLGAGVALLIGAASASSPLGWIAVAAALGTTLAPWGLAFIQSYAVDKKITVANLAWERVGRDHRLAADRHHRHGHRGGLRRHAQSHRRAHRGCGRRGGGAEAAGGLLRHRAVRRRTAGRIAARGGDRAAGDGVFHRRGHRLAGLAGPGLAPFPVLLRGLRWPDDCRRERGFACQECR